jgi:hypothetical protein
MIDSELSLALICPDTPIPSEADSLKPHESGQRNAPRVSRCHTCYCVIGVMAKAFFGKAEEKMMVSYLVWVNLSPPN